jgi:hypothetical protein
MDYETKRKGYKKITPHRPCRFVEIEKINTRRGMLLFNFKKGVRMDEDEASASSDQCAMTNAIDHPHCLRCDFELQWIRLFLVEVF